MTTRLLAVLVSAMFAVPSGAQTNEVQKQLNELQESNRAILKEVQELRKLIEQQIKGPQPDALPTAPVNVAGDPFKGNPKATVALIEFSDYQCPFCARYIRDTYPQLSKDYVDTGKVKYIWRDLPLESIHPNAFKAAEAAQCAGDQGRFWDMHDRLFANAQNLAPADLQKYAAALNLNAASFQQCIDSGKHAAGIRRDISDAAAIGVSGTPTFLIGTVQADGSIKVVKKLVGAHPYAEYKGALDSLLTPAP